MVLGEKLKNVSSECTSLNIVKLHFTKKKKIAEHLQRYLFMKSYIVEVKLKPSNY